jgi:hypothetical protein
MKSACLHVTDHWIFAEYCLMRCMMGEHDPPARPQSLRVQKFHLQSLVSNFFFASSLSWFILPLHESLERHVGLDSSDAFLKLRAQQEDASNTQPACTRQRRWKELGWSSHARETI